ncbi:pantoate--beta-alanine ligase [Bacillus salacetis]|uniref:Pantothenate synthetase n=1 Tax=Bacillus salacetis TaxID=2315464 RepID=A0A3A1R2U3_9BACI|nr:pantoate--beta-alanine ligase [Bacillus salacetis]RIW33124.1 pantoate--beta-alanine ligase [Bacillus salacetis]
MQKMTNISSVQEYLLSEKRQGKKIGFVPTMGFLHEGHLTLAEAARKENDIVVMSIFVNPLQFGPNEDFESYPRNPERDAALAASAGVDILFFPEADEMYSGSSIKMHVTERTDVLCGSRRTGHFDGVVTVVSKLFNIIGPDNAYFGLKDAQQVAVIEGLVHDLNFPVNIVRVPTVREEDGLAKSSRNVYLSETERAEAPVLYSSLKDAESLIEEGKSIPQTIISHIQNRINSETSGTVDYIEIYSFPELEDIHSLQGEFIIALAVKFQKARLIDNIIIKKSQEEKQNV